MNYLKFQLKKHKGLTLIETLVALVIFTISIAAVVGFAFYIYRSYNYTFSQARAINEARKGIQTMVKELREAKMGDDGSYILEKAEDYEIVFYSDIDKDDKTNTKLNGVISWISASAEFTPKIIQTKEERVNMVYAVKVKVQNDGSLKIGMPGEVNF